MADYKNVKEGDKILITHSERTAGVKGQFGVVIGEISDSAFIASAKVDGLTRYVLVDQNTDEFVILDERKEDKEGVKSVEDMLVALSQEVAELKRSLSEMERQQSINTSNIREIGEEASTANYKAGQALINTELCGSSADKKEESGIHSEVEIYLDGKLIAKEVVK